MNNLSIKSQSYIFFLNHTYFYGKNAIKRAKN